MHSFYKPRDPFVGLLLVLFNHVHIVFVNSV